MVKVPDSPENASRCICGDCPTYPSVGGFYCARGKSDATVAKKGCVCGDCPNFREYDLRDGYYCASGAAGESAQ